NIITGNTGNNIINGGVGNDTMIGGAGDDTYYVNSFLDKVIEKTNEGTDTVNSSIGYKLSSNVENLILTGNTNIAGSGNELANKIIGNSGSNYLFGYNGNDILNGKLGNDILVGGAGKDNFVFDTTLNATTNKDTIKDFNVADDTISLENAIFTKLTATGLLNSANFVSTTDGKAKDSNDYIVYNKTNGQLFYDADGNGSGASVLFAVIENKANLTNADFTVI
ncbi:calcium-binding protein, partial [Aliarcobacter cryaerophilus]